MIVDCLAGKKKLFDEIPHLGSARIELGKISAADADAIREMTANPSVYRYLPTFLFEKQCADADEMIRLVYEEPFTAKQSLILAIRTKADGALCGFAEFYGLRDDAHKVSIGYRLLERYWGRGIASETVALMVDYLFTQTDIELVTASVMIENAASSRVLEKNGFTCSARSVEEDWGFAHPAIVDKWVLRKQGPR